ncbi:MAG: suppressor of fused domain protein [Lachnospiraceae bacterium]|nr:suppressor of fused domain protein [Lachnospiraceae bacterium]
MELTGPGNEKVLQLSREQMEDIGDYVEMLYGQEMKVLHEIVSPDIHLDVLALFPTKERNYYTLITMGMSAYKMEIPEMYDAKELERCELIINLPADWNIQSPDEKDYWPIRHLKMAGRMPIIYKTWFTLGHTIANNDYEPFAPNTKLCGFSLASSLINNFTFRNGEKVNFYTLVPLYKEELQYSYKRGYVKLLDLFKKNRLPYPPIVDIKRKNMCRFKL